MDKDYILWLLGVLVLCFGGGLAGFLRLNDRIATVIERVVKMEVIISLLGETAAKVLHSPHTPELDALLEKYCDRYYELSNPEWTRLLEICTMIESNPKISKQERALAGFILAVSSHKLFLLPPVIQKHEDDKNFFPEDKEPAIV